MKNSSFIVFLAAAFLLLLVLLPGIFGGFSVSPLSPPPFKQGGGQQHPVCPSFLMEETLTNPTDTSAMLSLIPEENSDLYVEYGAQPGTYTSQTAPQRALAGQRTTFVLSPLNSGQRYYYRVQCKKAALSSFVPRQEYSFRTLRRDGDTFNFLVSTDSHLYAHYTRANVDNVCQTGWNGTLNAKDSLSLFNQSMENFLLQDADFLVIGGDEVMTQCSLCLSCYVAGQYAGSGTVVSQQQADLRYQYVFSPENYGQVTKYLPLFFKLGNHDGEPGFSDFLGSCGNTLDLLNFSRTARFKYLPNPALNYDGSPDGNYFTFTSGDAQFIIIDVMNGPTIYPQSADEWTLGPAQLQWLERVLQASRKKWKFIFSEHLDGGVSDAHCYYYGRGALKATDNGEINGTYLGEQAYLQELMETYNVTVFFQSHDHVMMAGEKRNIANGGSRTYYITGGSPAGSGGGWLTAPWFIQQMDYDNNGLADYNEDRWGSTQPGFFSVTVNGTNSVSLEYILTDYNMPINNGVAIFNFTIFGDGSSTLPIF